MMLRIINRTRKREYLKIFMIILFASQCLRMMGDAAELSHWFQDVEISSSTRRRTKCSSSRTLIHLLRLNSVFRQIRSVNLNQSEMRENSFSILVSWSLLGRPVLAIVEL